MTETLLTKETRDHASQARLAKRSQAEAIGVDEDFISEMVDRFYASIREDELLGPIFAERITEWPPHLLRMKQFWRSVLHNSGEFSGNPMAKHIAIPNLSERHFSRWLELFYANLRQMEAEPRAVRMIGERARTIAESLLIGIAIRRDGVGGGFERKGLPHV